MATKTYRAKRKDNPPSVAAKAKTSVGKLVKMNPALRARIRAGLPVITPGMSLKVPDNKKPKKLKPQGTGKGKETGSGGQNPKVGSGAYAGTQYGKGRPPGLRQKGKQPKLKPPVMPGDVAPSVAVMGPAGIGALPPGTAVPTTIAPMGAAGIGALPPGTTTIAAMGPGGVGQVGASAPVVAPRLQKGGPLKSMPSTLQKGLPGAPQVVMGPAGIGAQPPSIAPRLQKGLPVMGPAGIGAQPPGIFVRQPEQGLKSMPNALQKGIPVMGAAGIGANPPGIVVKPPQPPGQEPWRVPAWEEAQIGRGIPGGITVAVMGILQGLRPDIVYWTDQAYLGLNDLQMMAMGYEKDSYGNWIRLEKVSGPAGTGGGGGGYGGYSGGGYSGYSGRGSGYRVGGEDGGGYGYGTSPTGRVYYPSEMGLVTWRI